MSTITNMDAPVEVLMTENIRHFIRTVLLTSDLPNDTRDELRKYGGSTRRSSASSNNRDDGRRPRTIPFQLLRSVHDMQLVKGDKRYRFVVYYYHSFTTNMHTQVAIYTPQIQRYLNKQQK